MAGYRPKSLNELNDMYDKTITAEKAIIKASRQLHDVTESIVPSAAVEAPAPEMPKEETKAVEALSSEVDSLINRFKSEMAMPKAAHTETVAKPEPAEKISLTQEAKPAEEIPAPVVIAKPKAHYDLEVPGEVAEKATARSDERTELFDDYMKIMNDEDDDFFAKHESFKKKSKKKKHKKSFFSRREPSEEEFTEAEDDIQEELSETAVAIADNTEPEEADEGLPVREVIFSPEVPAEAEGLKIEFTAKPEESDDEEEFVSFASEAYEESEEVLAEEIQEEADDDVDAVEEAEEAHPDFDIGEEKNEELPPVPQDIAETTYEDFMNSEDIYSYDPNKMNTSPDYDEDNGDFSESYEEEAYEEYDDEAEEGYDSEAFTEVYPMPKNKKGIMAGRVILSIILSLLCVSTVAIAALNLVLGVNSGREVLGGKFIFTAESTYTDAGILSGDLVITENRYAEDGEVFAYINYTQQCFMFGKRNGSIVNDSSDVLFIAENDGERVLVLRDDTKGVVTNIYPTVGKFVGLCVTYFIPILAVMLILGLVIVLLLAFVFKDKEKAYKKMINKMVKKGVITAEEEDEYSYAVEGEQENLFSTMD